MSFWSSKPFVSLDGEDENGVRAEVEVVLGYGTVREMDRKEKTAKVVFQASHPKFFPAGWLPVGQEAFEIVEKAMEDETPLYFRIEKIRKKSEDRTLPISTWKTMDENRESTNKSVAAVRLNETDEWVFNKFAVTNPKEDPNSNGSRPSALSMSAADLAASKGSNASTSEGFEPPPYVTKTRDGKINPGSTAVAVPLNILSYLSEYDRDHDNVIGEKKKITLVKVLLSAANELQKGVYDGDLETPDLGAGSHTRARALIFENIRTYFPITEEVLDSKESITEWKDELVKKSLGMWKWSIKEVESLS